MGIFLRFSFQSVFVLPKFSKSDFEDIFLYEISRTVFDFLNRSPRFRREWSTGYTCISFCLAEQTHPVEGSDTDYNH